MDRVMWQGYLQHSGNHRPQWSDISLQRGRRTMKDEAHVRILPEISSIMNKMQGIDNDRRHEGLERHKFWTVATGCNQLKMHIWTCFRFYYLGLVLSFNYYFRSYVISMLNLLDIDNRCYVRVKFYFFHTVRPPDTQFVF